jgi:tRNA pseudouridine32 synthase / 23S rRNA pseudouridine746 synthase
MQLIWHDEHLLIVNKPAGLLSVPGRSVDNLLDNKDCVVTRLQMQFPDALTVHRLDQVTSGVMVFARSKFVQSRLSYQFMHRRTVKHYEALVQGLVQDEQGEIDLPLMADWPERPKQKVSHDEGKPAHTSWRVKARDKTRQISRLALTPTTGRTHQLRVHLAAIGHPIVGDVLYGAAPSSRVYLHATSLQFLHPISKAIVSYSVPADF